MERIFNYLKLYLVEDDVNFNNTKINTKLIIGAKYLIVNRTCNNNKFNTEIIVGLIFSDISNCGYFLRFTNYNSSNVIQYSYYNLYSFTYFQLVPDFNFSFCSDIIHTFYSFTNIESNFSDNHIYIIKRNNKIIISDGNKYRSYCLKFSTNKNLDINYNYILSVHCKIPDT